MQIRVYVRCISFYVWLHWKTIALHENITDKKMSFNTSAYVFHANVLKIIVQYFKLILVYSFGAYNVIYMLRGTFSVFRSVFKWNEWNRIFTNIVFWWYMAIHHLKTIHRMLSKQLKINSLFQMKSSILFRCIICRDLIRKFNHRSLKRVFRIPIEWIMCV